MMNFSVKAFFFLGVSFLGLGLIFSHFTEGKGFILGDSDDEEMSRVVSPTEFSGENEEQRKRRDEEKRLKREREEKRREEFRKRDREEREKRTVKEIVIPKKIQESEKKEEQQNEGKKEERREEKSSSEMDGVSKKEEQRNPARISVTGDVKISAEVEVEEDEGVQERGFYAREIVSGKESYLGKGEEVSRGKFEYKNDLSKQLSNGKQEIVFKSKKEKVGSQGERFILEESKSVPVDIDVKDDEAEDELKKKIKDRFVEELKISKKGTEKIAEIESLSPEEVSLLKEAEEKDFDQDGITNFEEKSRGTDPFLADSDNDGFLDGDEVKTGHDPKKFSPGDGRDRIVFENPKEVVEKEKKNPEKKTVDERYRVEKVEIIKAETPQEKEKVRFSGKALPNIFVTLYIYSDPIVVTVKTDADGKWFYDLDKDVEDGDHEAYVAITDNTGKITARSEGIGFVKAANAITVKPVAAASDAPEIQSPIERSRVEYILIAFIVSFFFFGLALLVASRRMSSVG